MNKFLVLIVEFLKSLNITRYKFSKLSGVSEATLLNIYKGKNKPSIDFLVKLLKTFKAINLNWLITGEGDMLLQDQSTGKPPPITQNDDACKQEVEFYKRLLKEKEAELKQAYMDMGKLQANCKAKKESPYSDRTQSFSKLTSKGEKTNEKSQS